MTGSKEYPATRTVHWPSGPVDCCDKHAQQLMTMNEALGGGHIAHTYPPEGAECVNCINEAKSDD